MEDGGSFGTEGSHFERTLLYDELMTGDFVEDGSLYSIMTLSYLTDTGFYRPL